MAGGEQQFPLLQIRRGELGEHQIEENKWLQLGALEERQNGDLEEMSDSWHVSVMEAVK